MSEYQFVLSSCTYGLDLDFFCMLMHNTKRDGICSIKVMDNDSPTHNWHICEELAVMRFFDFWKISRKKQRQRAKVRLALLYQLSNV